MYKLYYAVQGHPWPSPPRKHSRHRNLIRQTSNHYTWKNFIGEYLTDEKLTDEYFTDEVLNDEYFIDEVPTDGYIIDGVLVGELKGIRESTTKVHLMKFFVEVLDYIDEVRLLPLLISDTLR